MTMNSSVAWSRVKERLSMGDLDYPCPQLDAPQKELNRLWEELNYYLPSQLDDLIVALRGGESVNTNSSNALKKLRPLFGQTFDWKFNDPEFVRRESQKLVSKKEKLSLHLDDTQPEEEETVSDTEETKVKKIKVKKVEAVEAKSSPKKKIKAEADEEKAENMIELSDLAKKQKVDPILLRRALRDSKINKPSGSWRWPAGHKDLKAVEKLASTLK